MVDENKNIDETINKLISNAPQKKQLADVLFSSTDIITKIHNIRSKLIDSIDDIEYLRQLTPEQWVAISDALTNAEGVTGGYINAQARIAEKTPAIQNVYTILAGQLAGQVVNQNQEKVEETEKIYEIPKEIMPIKQAIETTLDSRMGINRAQILDDYESSNKIDNESENNEQ